MESATITVSHIASFQVTWVRHLATKDLLWTVTDRAVL